MFRDGKFQMEKWYGVPTRCAVCGSLVKHTYTWFVNQHGAKIRCFCDCGVWTDRQVYYATGQIRLCSILKVDEKRRLIFRVDIPRKGQK